MGEIRILNFRHEIAGENLVIAIAQDAETNEILMVAYMNRKAFKRTLQTGKAHYWSVSRGKIWLKGESSGHFQKVKEILVDCDKDAIILKVEQEGGACHTGHYSCFYRRLIPEDMKLEKVGRKVFDPEDIYGDD